MREDTLADWLAELYAAHGRLTPEIVREAARPPESPAHHAVFSLPVGEAAERHYLERARRLIQTVRVEVRRADEPPRFVRAWHAVPGDAEQRSIFLPVAELIARPDKLTLARNEAVRRVREAQRAVEDLDAVTGEDAGKARAATALERLGEARALLAS